MTTKRTKKQRVRRPHWSYPLRIDDSSYDRLSAGWKRGGAALVLSLLLAPALPAAEDGFLWIEAEAAAESTVVRHSWYRSVKPALLSGGDWIAHFGERETTAEYRVEAPARGRRALWVRANPIQSALSFRVGGGPWKEIDAVLLMSHVRPARGGQAAARSRERAHGGPCRSGSRDAVERADRLPSRSSVPIRAGVPLAGAAPRP